MRIDVDLSGLSDAIKKIKAYELTKKEGVQRVIAETAVNIQSEAISRTPVETGNLKGEWNMDIRPDGLGAVISNPVEYAPYVEFGTSRAKAQPMLFPAFELNRPKYIEDLMRELRNTE